jgi:hypothetical protein
LAKVEEGCANKEAKRKGMTGREYVYNRDGGMTGEGEKRKVREKNETCTDQQKK